MATTAGQTVVNGAVVNLVCNTANPTPYAEWPDPATGDADPEASARAAARAASLDASARPRRRTRDADRRRVGRGDDADERGDAPNSRLLYVTNPLTSDVRISGTPRVTLNGRLHQARRRT